MGGTQKGWVGVFDERARQGSSAAGAGRPLPLHQIAGWHDILEASLWREYVLDGISGVISEGDSVFEAGCGVLAYLRVIAETFSDLDIWGVDGSEAAVAYAKSVAPEIGLSPAQFSVGTLPACLKRYPDQRFDATLCHSVLQYMPDLAAADRVVRELIRITTEGGVIHLGDLRDAAQPEANTKHALRHWQGDNLGLPAMQSFDREWFRRFEPSVEISLSRSQITSFGRHEFRFNISLHRRRLDHLIP